MSSTTFQIGEHAYDVTLHATRDGLKIVRALGRVLAGPLGAAVETAAKGAGGAAGLLSAIGEGRWSDLNIDLSDVGDKIGDAIERLPEDIERQILAHTLRDGKPLVAKDQYTATFDAAYQGNYGELLEALMRVVKLNGFIPGLS